MCSSDLDGGNSAAVLRTNRAAQNCRTENTDLPGDGDCPGGSGSSVQGNPDFLRISHGKYPDRPAEYSLFFRDWLFHADFACRGAFGAGMDGNGGDYLLCDAAFVREGQKQTADGVSCSAARGGSRTALFFAVSCMKLHEKTTPFSDRKSVV